MNLMVAFFEFLILQCLQIMMKKINNISINMQSKICIFFLLLSTISYVSTWQYNNPYLSAPLNVVRQEWLDQDIDHFNYNSNATFKQRYYILDDYYVAGGPAYLYICGQAECKGISNTSWTAAIARQTKGLIFALEHRYYGKSLPFLNESMSFENLKYLNSEQGLSDLAYFIQFITKHKMYGVTSQTKWVTVGGSYAGAMSAWFRSKYPHLTVGALGSSGVVLAVQDFTAFDRQVYKSAAKNGPGCTTALQKVNLYVQSIINSDSRLDFQAQFKAEQLTATQFLFYWADVIVFQFQYSRGVEFCSSISGKTDDEVFQVIKALALTISPVDYGAYYLKNATFAIQDGRGARAWIYQSCTEFSYFQTPSQTPLRSQKLDLNFYKQWCANIFGQGVWPFVNRVNNEFGGLQIKASNLYLSNGDEDPWRWAGLQESKGNIISRVYVCPNCGHCFDLRGPDDSNPDDVKAVRAEQLANIKKWISSNNQYRVM